jgi:hypothetical protein
MLRADSAPFFPLNRWKIADSLRFTRLALPMTAGQANRSHIYDVSFIRYFVFANCGRTRDDGSFAFVTRIRADVKKMFSHKRPTQFVANLNEY